MTSLWCFYCQLWTYFTIAGYSGDWQNCQKEISHCLYFHNDFQLTETLIWHNVLLWLIFFVSSQWRTFALRRNFIKNQKNLSMVNSLNQKWNITTKDKDTTQYLGLLTLLFNAVSFFCKRVRGNHWCSI